MKQEFILRGFDDKGEVVAEYKGFSTDPISEIEIEKLRPIVGSIISHDNVVRIVMDIAIAR
jgi:hypothetical protein